MNANIIKCLFLFVAGIMSMSVYGQDISVNSVEETVEITASKYERKDANGKSCAVIKVEIPSVEGLVFNGSVGNTQHLSGVYQVYVSPEIATLPIYKDNEKVCEVNFADYNIKIEPKHTYIVKLTVSQLREMIFKITPATAILTVNDKAVKLNEEGIGYVDCEIGVQYDYTLTAEGYKNMEGEFTYTDDENGHEPLTVSMERKTAPVTFISNVKEFEVIIDGESKTIKNKDVLYLPVGSTSIRFVAPKYEDYELTETILEGGNTIAANMQKSSNVSKKLRLRWGIIAGGGVAIPLGSSEYKVSDAVGYPVKVGVEWESYLTRWITLRYGVEGILYCGKDMEVEKKTPWAANFPLLLNFNVPLGKLNRNFFTIGFGPLAGCAGFMKNDEDKENNESYEDNSSFSSDSQDDITLKNVFVGGRIEARAIIRHFMIGTTIDYHYSNKVLNRDGVITPMITLGYRF